MSDHLFQQLTTLAYGLTNVRELLKVIITPMMVYPILQGYETGEQV